MTTVDYVDIPRFMGEWFVIAGVPTFFERNAVNPVERYELQSDGTIATTFTYRKKHMDAPLEVMEATGYITDTNTNAIWGMQFIWPIKADYRVVYLDEDYRFTIIGRQKRDYLWIMARQPDVADEELEALIRLAVSLGYHREEIRRFPQPIDAPEASQP